MMMFEASPDTPDSSSLFLILARPPALESSLETADELTWKGLVTILGKRAGVWDFGWTSTWPEDTMVEMAKVV